MSDGKLQACAPAPAAAPASPAKQIPPVSFKGNCFGMVYTDTASREAAPAPDSRPAKAPARNNATSAPQGSDANSSALSSLLFRANNAPWQPGLTRAQLLETRTQLAIALRNCTDPQERLHIIGALRSVAEAGGERGLLTPSEVLGGPEAVDVVTGAGAFGGSSGGIRQRVVPQQATARPPDHPRPGRGGSGGDGVYIDQRGAVAAAKAPRVIAEGQIGDKTFVDVNQTARVGGRADQPTLIAERIAQKTAENPSKNYPNGSMATAHAEIGVIQQAYDAGATQGASMTLKVGGEPVCGYCRGDIAAAAKASGLRSLTVLEATTGRTLVWQPGMKSLQPKE